MSYFNLIVFLFLSNFVYSQSPKYLVLEHREKPKEYIIYEGELVVVAAKSGHKTRGPLRIVSENLIQVKNKVIPVSKVAAIGKKNQIMKTVASLVVTNGMNLLIAGINDNLKNGWGEISSIHKASLPMLSSGIPLLFIMRKRKAIHWKMIPIVEGPYF